MDWSAKFAAALPYREFLEKYGSDVERRRWEEFHQSVSLTDAQRQLLGSFVRDMPVLVMAGTWCGDCVNQCPIFDRFASASACIRVRFVDRDADPELAAALHTCGAARVPAVVFLSEDGQFCGRYGDRTLARYRQLAETLSGAACSTGLADATAAAVVQDWLNEFERVQWMLRTSARLRQKHGD
jgi:thiol-disulfide isomerase/thioredoxin